MKKSILVLSALVFLGAMSLLAQDKKESARKVGTLRLGWHSASQVLDGDKQQGSESHNSIFLGFSRDTKIIPLLWFGSGVEYFQNGLDYTDNTRRVLHTISVPVNLKLKLGPVYALTGFAANFKVSEKIKTGDSSVNPLDSDKSKWFDAPFFMGAGLKILFVSVEARYHWGTIEARNSLYNRYLQVGAAFTF
jgi:hypothetical protein